MPDQTSGANQQPEQLPGRGVGALLSFLVPGLGQIYQGLIRKNRDRLIKGVFFLVTLWGMFFYGMWLGRWQNVYLPHMQEQLIAEGRPLMVLNRQLPPFLGNVYTRLQYAGQFWIGVLAWPALWNYAFPDKPIFGSFQASPGAVPAGRDQEERRYDALQQALQRQNELALDPEMGKRWDIAWVYTVIAGVLNILVIYDAWSGPVALTRRPEPDQKEEEKGNEK